MKSRKLHQDIRTKWATGQLMHYINVSNFHLALAPTSMAFLESLITPWIDLKWHLSGISLYDWHCGLQPKWKLLYAALNFHLSAEDWLCLYRLGSSCGCHWHRQISANPNFIHSSWGPLDFKQTSSSSKQQAASSRRRSPRHCALSPLRAFISTMKNMSLQMSSENDI